MFGQYAHALDDLFRTDTDQVAYATARCEHHHLVRDQLIGVAVGGQQQALAAALRLGIGRRGHEIVGFVASQFAVAESESARNARQPVKLFDDSVVENSPALIGRQEFMAVRIHTQCVPGDEDRSRLLRIPHRKEHVGPADDGVDRSLAIG